jgi:hypothetical protein
MLARADDRYFGKRKYNFSLVLKSIPFVLILIIIFVIKFQLVLTLLFSLAN